MPNAYDTLLDHVRDTYALRSAGSLLGWDQETMMPIKGGETRARSLSAISRVLHQRVTDTAFGDLLAAAETNVELSATQQACLKALRRDRDKAVKIPEQLAADLALTSSLSQQAWVDCRANNDAAAFLPWLNKLMALKRREIECLGPVAHPYDALLDQYEPGATVASIRPVLESLGKQTTELLPAILDKQGSYEPATPWGQMRFALPAQQAMNENVLTAMGFDLQAGRLDASAHPFTESLGARDVRLTTRYREDDIQNALYSTLHEGGHGLYEQGFSAEHALTPLAEAVSLGIHESQSRLWENAIGRSLPFWRWLTPRMRQHFTDLPSTCTPEALWQRANRVSRSFIRVEADEVSYNLHIVLRFRLEEALFSGQLQVQNLEAAWNDGMHELLGITPAKASQGFLQDVHWSCGLFGYFPTYTLGNLVAAQLLEALRRDFTDLDMRIEKGDFAPIREWLRRQVHGHGRSLTPEQIVMQATGEALSSAPFLRYVKTKYLG
jgi:carboxypeptidase Taq